MSTLSVLPVILVLSIIQPVIFLAVFYFVVKPDLEKRAGGISPIWNNNAPSAVSYRDLNLRLFSVSFPNTWGEPVFEASYENESRFSFYPLGRGNNGDDPVRITVSCIPKPADVNYGAAQGCLYVSEALRAVEQAAVRTPMVLNKQMGNYFGTWAEINFPKNKMVPAKAVIYYHAELPGHPGDYAFFELNQYTGTDLPNFNPDFDRMIESMRAF